MLIMLSMSLVIHCQTTIYHEYEPTASDFMILRWNINPDNLPSWYIQENVDEFGRVIELKFYENGKIKSEDLLCYLEAWLKYEYPNDTTIILYALDSNGDKGGNFECESPYKITYILSNDKRTIVNYKTEYNIDTTLLINAGWTKEKIEKALNSMQKNQTVPSIIGGYLESFSKLGGLFPISKDFIPKYYVNDTAEGIELGKSLNKK